MRLRLNAIFFVTLALMLVSWLFSINGFYGTGFILFMLSIVSMIGTVFIQMGTRRRIAHLRLVK